PHAPPPRMESVMNRIVPFALVLVVTVALVACTGGTANPSGVASLARPAPRPACARGPRLRAVHARARRRHARPAGRLERRDVVLDRRRTRRARPLEAAGGTGGLP